MLTQTPEARMPLQITILLVSTNSSCWGPKFGILGLELLSLPKELWIVVEYQLEKMGNIHPMTDPYVCHIWFAIDHQYTPVMLAYIPYMDPMGLMFDWCCVFNAFFFSWRFEFKHFEGCVFAQEVEEGHVSG